MRRTNQVARTRLQSCCKEIRKVTASVRITSRFKIAMWVLCPFGVGLQCVYRRSVHVLARATELRLPDQRCALASPISSLHGSCAHLLIHHPVARQGQSETPTGRPNRVQFAMRTDGKVQILENNPCRESRAAAARRTCVSITRWLVVTGCSFMQLVLGRQRRTGGTRVVGSRGVTASDWFCVQRLWVGCSSRGPR